MKPWLLIFSFLLLSSVSTSLNAAKQHAKPKDQFERITPEKAGYSKAVLKRLKAHLEQKQSSAMLILHKGKVVFEWGDLYKKHTIHSIRKSLLSSLLGIAWGEGKVDLNSRLASLDMPEALKGLTKTEKQATVKMVLQSRSGIYLPAAAESQGMKQQKPKRGAHTPGEHFYYNNWDFNFAGYYYEAISGNKLFDAFNRLIAQPIGMQQFQGETTSLSINSDQLDDVVIPNSDGFYMYETDLSAIPAYHFRLSTHDLALYGQLLLNRGKWKGQQIIPEQWIDLSTQPYSVTNQQYNLAYGMLWNVIIPDEHQTEPNAFYHTGTGVHMLGIYPQQDMVMVHRVDTEKQYSFKNYDLYPVIRLMHQAKQSINSNNSGE